MPPNILRYKTVHISLGDDEMKKIVSIIMVLGFAVTLASAEVRTAAVFSDNMVLQQGKAVAVWGWADPGEKVRVTFGKCSGSAVADKQGNWKVSIGPLNVNSTGIELRVNTLIFKNVLVGEVWVCSGQSNMGWKVTGAKNPAEEIADAKNYPLVRLFTVANVTSPTPLNDTKGEWTVASPESVGRFSAVGYFFGRELHKNLKVPIGLINSSWGGTPAEAWTSRKQLETVGFLKAAANKWDQRVKNYDSFAANKKYEEKLAVWVHAAAIAKAMKKPAPRRPRKPSHPESSPQRPASLYNGMIAPISQLTIAGVIWYQGESNARRAKEYRTLFPLMISNWRKDWNQGDFPFLFVQLANFLAVQAQPVQTDASWPFLREAQTMTLSLKNTAMASAIDIGDAGNIHPKNKQDVGRRLSLAARSIAYKQKNVFSGPMYKSMKIVKGKIELTFDHAEAGLETRDGGDLKGFAIAGKDGKWLWAKAKIEGSKVVVWSDEVSAPTAVRYGWANNPIGNLNNAGAESLPANPFRTDID